MTSGFLGKQPTLKIAAPIPLVLLGHAAISFKINLGLKKEYVCQLWGLTLSLVAKSLVALL